MLVLLIGLVIFLGIHIVPAVPGMKDSLRARIGDTGYKILFSVASTVGLVLIIWGFGLARQSPADVQLWTPPIWTKHIAFALMPFAFILLASAYIPSHIRDRAKHPMLAAIKLWAFVHLLANGDLAGVLLFGTFLAYGVYDRISAKRRAALGPLGRTHGGIVGDIAAVVIGLALYVTMLLWGHRVLIGIPLVG